jgi:hypothetical protein
MTTYGGAVDVHIHAIALAWGSYWWFVSDQARFFFRWVVFGIVYGVSSAA